MMGGCGVWGLVSRLRRRVHPLCSLDATSLTGHPIPPMPPIPLSHHAARTLVVQGAGPYTGSIRQLEADIVAGTKKVNELIGACGSAVGMGGWACASAAWVWVWRGCAGHGARRTICGGQAQIEADARESQSAPRRHSRCQALPPSTLTPTHHTTTTNHYPPPIHSSTRRREGDRDGPVPPVAVGPHRR